VEQQFRIACGEPVSFVPGLAESDGEPFLTVDSLGHAIEFRVYAEDPKRFLPSPGAIREWQEPSGPGVRVDSGYSAGTRVTHYYDPLMAKLCVYGVDREQALERSRAAVKNFVVEGPKTNLQFFLELLDDPGFVSGDYDTAVVDRMRAV
jgi:acetyl-CoA carboxylase biotin carboxylase subunit